MKKIMKRIITIATVCAMLRSNVLTVLASEIAIQRSELSDPAKETVGKYFNETEYLQAKLAQLQNNSDTQAEWSDKEIPYLKNKIEEMGLNPWKHYLQYGAWEHDKQGALINPSNAFDANAYFAAKLAQLTQQGDETFVSVHQLVQFFKEARMDPVTHYITQGAQESQQFGVSFVQTVPSQQRVSNDPAREVNGENVPSNYNPPSLGPAYAIAKQVTKLADMGGLSGELPELPQEASKVPGDKGYNAPPQNVIDTNSQPVIAPSTENTGNLTDYWVSVQTNGIWNVQYPPEGGSAGTIDARDYKGSSIEELQAFVNNYGEYNPTIDRKKIETLPSGGSTTLSNKSDNDNLEETSGSIDKDIIRDQP